KFNGNSDESFFVGYSLNSKAFRVYNIRTWKVKENLHVRFLEDKPIIEGTNSNDFVDSSLFDFSSKNASNNESQPSNNDGKKDDDGVFDDQEKPKNNTHDVNTDGSSINISSTNFNIGSLNISIVSPPVINATPEATYADLFGDETEIDVKSVFLNGRIEEEVYVCKPLGFEDSDHPNKVYKVVKALYGLHQAPRVDSPFELVAYTDSYAGASLDRISTTEGCQFLGSKLISWQCKKQIVVATSIIKAEYVAATSCCGQVLWIQNQMLDYGAVDNGEQEITATVDGKVFTVTEASVRRHLQLADAEREQTPLFPTMLEIEAKEGEGSRHPFEPQPPSSTSQPTHEEQIPIVASSSHQKTQTPRHALHQVTKLPWTSEPIRNVADEVVYEEWDDIVERATTTAASLDAAQASGHILKTQSTTIPNVPLP
nr:putative ribonuclease H-like domain-containing protein [Tanacetum cinerariifolium]